MRLIGIVVGAALGLAVVAEGCLHRSHPQPAGGGDREAGCAQQPARRRHGRPGSGVCLGGRAAHVRSTTATARTTAAARRLPPPRLVERPPAAAPPRAAAIGRSAAAAAGHRFTPRRASSCASSCWPSWNANGRRRSVRQEERRRAARAGAPATRVAKELGLSPAETEKFNQIIDRAQAPRAQACATRSRPGRSPARRSRQAMMAMRRENEQQLRALLGDDRMKKYEDLRGATRRWSIRRWGPRGVRAAGSGRWPRRARRPGLRGGPGISPRQSPERAATRRPHAILDSFANDPAR